MVRCMTYDPDIAITLWPGYFDINRTRSEGRRLPKELCVSNPDLGRMAPSILFYLSNRIQKTPYRPIWVGLPFFCSSLIT